MNKVLGISTGTDEDASGRPLLLKRKTVRRAVSTSEGRFIVFVVLHILLALVIWYWRPMASLYAYATLAAGLAFALSKAPLEKVAYAAAYITSAEVAWRMTNANVFWETGKYAIILLFVIALFRARAAKFPVLPVLYFAVLLPATILTLSTVSLSDARSQISFNLSGPLALMVCAVFFSNLRLTLKQLKTLLLALAAPIAVIATTALISTLTASTIVWVDDSIFATSGGFGPNQVSAALSLGALALWLLPLLGPTKHRILLVLIGGWYFIQSMMTFSRGGAADTAAALIAVVILIIVNDRSRLKLLIPLALGIVVFVVFFLPFLDSVTNNKFGVRFTDPTTTDRILIGQANLDAFQSSPIWGIGVGMGTNYDTTVLGFREAAHTEFTRLLAEHGLLGAAALGILILIAASSYSRNRRTEGCRLLVIAAATWAFAYMTNAGMRTVAPSFMMGLTCVSFVVAQPLLPPSEHTRRGNLT